MSSEPIVEGLRILSPQERRQRNRDEMTSAILAAARANMREEGVAGLNLHELARRVGMTPPALYGYFPSKAAIYDALYHQAALLVLEHDEEVWQAHPPGWGRIRAWFNARLAFALEYPELYHLGFSAPVPGFTPSDESVAATQAQLASVVRGLGEVFEVNAIAPGVPTQRAIDLLLAIRHGIIAEIVGKATVIPPGSGRFEHLVDDAIAVLRAAWSTES